MITRTPYPSDMSEDEWAFMVPYLTLLSEDASQRHYALHEVFNALHWLVRAGVPSLATSIVQAIAAVND